MITPYKSIKALLSDYEENSGNDLISETKRVKKWGNDEVRTLITTDQLHKYVVLLDVKNNESYLPENYQAVIQAGFKKVKGDRYNRQNIIRYVSQEKITGCKVQVNVECPTCHKKDCTCITPILIYEVDDVELSKNPEWMAQANKSFYRYGRFGDAYVHGHSPDFELMNPSVNNFADKRSLHTCYPINTGNNVGYWVETSEGGAQKLVIDNVDECKVLLSYHGYKMDDDGYLMIPDLPEVWETLTYTIDMRRSYIRWIQFRRTEDERQFFSLKRIKEESERLAKIKLSRIEPARFKAIWMNFVGKEIPHYYAEETYYDYVNDTFRRYK